MPAAANEGDAGHQYQQQAVHIPAAVSAGGIVARPNGERMATEKQVSYIKDLFDKQGYSQDDRAQLVKVDAGRTVGALKDLTFDEAKAVLDDLLADQ